MKESTQKFLFGFAMIFNIAWSNYRWRNCIKRYPVEEKYDTSKGSVDTWVKATTTKLYKNFKWTADGPDQLFDAIRTPAQNYADTKTGICYDDCDGYAGIAYHFLHENMSETGVTDIQYVSIGSENFKSCHTMCAYKHNDKWHIVDYDSVYHFGYDNLKETMNEYWLKIFKNYYGAEGNFATYVTYYYDYNINKIKYIGAI